MTESGFWSVFSSFYPFFFEGFVPPTFPFVRKPSASDQNDEKISKKSDMIESTSPSLDSELR